MRNVRGMSSNRLQTLAYRLALAAVLCSSLLSSGCKLRMLGKSGLGSSGDGLAAIHAPSLPSVEDFTFPSNSIEQGEALSIHVGSGSGSGQVDYECAFDRIVDGDVASGSACSELPGSISFDGSSGQFEWTPNTHASGAYEIKVTGQNSLGSDTRVWVINVRESYPMTGLVHDFNSLLSAMSLPAENPSTSWTNLIPARTAPS